MTFVQGHKRSINAGKSKHTKQQQSTQTRRWPGNLRAVGGCVFGLFFVFFHYEPRRFMVNFLICAYSNVRTESQRYRPQQETWSWRKVACQGAMMDLYCLSPLPTNLMMTSPTTSSTSRLVIWQSGPASFFVWARATFLTTRNLSQSVLGFL